MTDTPERITVSFKNWRNPNVGACYKNDAGDTGYVREDLHKALTAERDARIDPAHVEDLIKAAEPILAEANAALRADNARLLEVLKDCAQFTGICGYTARTALNTGKEPSHD